VVSEQCAMGRGDLPVEIEVVILELCGIVTETGRENRFDCFCSRYNGFPVEEEAGPHDKLVPP
jgi:hypothetical protein